MCMEHSVGRLKQKLYSFIISTHIQPHLQTMKMQHYIEVFLFHTIHNFDKMVFKSLSPSTLQKLHSKQFYLLCKLQHAFLVHCETTFILGLGA